MVANILARVISKSPEQVRVVGVSDMTSRAPLDRDDLELARSGHAAQLTRKLGFWSMLCTVTVIMSSWTSYMGSVIAGLTSGGPTAMLWGYCLVWILTIFSGASMAEMLSIWPTAAGQIHWTNMLAPRGWGPVISFYVGWITITGQVAITAAAAYIIGSNVLGMYILVHPDHVSQPYQVVLGYWGILVIGCIFNIFQSKRLGNLMYFALGLSLSGWLTTLVVQAAKSPTRNSAKYVFTTVVNETGWSSDGVAWILGLLQSAYALTGYDSVAHLAEELEDASRTAPRALVLSILISGLFCIPYLIVTLFFIGDVSVLAASPTGFPFLQIMYDCVKNNAGAIVLAFCTTGMAMTAIPGLIASTSRTIWAFSRDGAVPFHKTFGKVNHRLDVPLNAVILTTVLMMLPAFIYLGNSTAFQAFLSATVICLNGSYAVAILLMLFGGRKRAEEEGSVGRWTLGRWGPLVNVIGGAYNVFISIFLFFPSYQPVDATNMNYAIVIVGLVFICATLYWWLPGGARGVYPIVEVLVADNEQTSEPKIDGAKLDEESRELK
ncbi:amino acid transporter [Meredithblackwellia eburnea MCA 4105]